MGDPIRMTTLKADSTFNGDTMIRAKDTSYISIENFHIAIKRISGSKNLSLDRPGF